MVSKKGIREKTVKHKPTTRMCTHLGILCKDIVAQLQDPFRGIKILLHTETKNVVPRTLVVESFLKTNLRSTNEVTNG